jgi:tetratricopeptide (TPR) repeat protein
MAVLHANVDLMREQIGLARNERFRNRIKAVRDGTLVAGLAAVLIGFAALLFSASTDRSVVMQAWSLPPGLEEQGLTGGTVAADLVGRISQMQREAEDSSFVASINTLEEGEDALKVEIPSTGVSIGDLETWLRQRLGRRTTIGGSIQQTADRLVLTVRVSGRPSETFTGGPDALPDLMRQAAETVMRQTQPLRYADFLSATGRFDEARAVLVPMTAQGSAEDRASAFASLGQVFQRSGDIVTGETIGRHAVRLNPDDVNTQMFLAFSAYSLSHSQLDFDALTAAQRALKDGKARSRLSPAGRERAEPLIAYGLAEDQADFLRAAEMMARVEATYRGETSPTPYLGSRPIVLARARDVPASREAMMRQQQAGDDGLLIPVGRLQTELYQAAALDDWASVLDLSRPLFDPGQSLPASELRERLARPLFVLGLARTGDLPGARAAISTTPIDCDFCLRVRGTVEGLAGDAQASDRAFRAVTRRAPSLPFAFSEWGEAKLARGDIAGAIVLFRQAQAIGPRWADPVKYEADALVRQGDDRAALRGYAAAAKLAPRWGALHIAWGEALARSGRQEQAQLKWREASAMALSPGDQARLTSLLMRH